MKKNQIKNISIEDLDNRFNELSSMIAKGFESTATTEELKTLATKEELKNLERKVDKIDFRVDQIHEILDHGEKDFLGLQRRVQVLEKINKPQHT